MELYGTVAQNKIPQIILTVCQVILIGISFLILFIVNTGFTPAVFSPYSLSLYVIICFNILTFARILFSLFIFMNRKMPVNETVSVVFAFGAYYIGFSLFAVFSVWSNYLSVIIGIILFLAGSVFHIVAESQRYIWKKNKDRQGHLYTSGLFSLSRHPNYFGDCLWVLGYAIAASSLWALAVPVLLFCFFYFYNIPLQETYLEKKYKKEFIDYRNSVKKLVPFIL